MSSRCSRAMSSCSDSGVPLVGDVFAVTALAGDFHGGLGLGVGVRTLGDGVLVFGDNEEDGNDEAVVVGHYST